jgi:hypothetical protein
MSGRTQLTLGIPKPTLVTEAELQFSIRPSLPHDPDLPSILLHTGCVEGALKLNLKNSRQLTLYLSLSPNAQFPLFGELDVPTNPHSTPIPSSKPLALSRVPTSPSDPNMISNTLYDNFTPRQLRLLLSCVHL